MPPLPQQQADPNKQSSWLPPSPPPPPGAPGVTGTAAAGATPATAPTAQAVPPTTPQAPVDDSWKGSIDAIAQRHGVDPELVRRMIQQESGGNPRIDGKMTRFGWKAAGLMQLSPGVIKQYNIDPYDPYQNMAAGTAEIARLLKKYNGHYGRALAAYNSGEGNVDQVQGGIPAFPETQNYVMSILNGYEPPKAAQPGAAPAQQAAPTGAPTPAAAPTGPGAQAQPGAQPQQQPAQPQQPAHWWQKLIGPTAGPGPGTQTPPPGTVGGPEAGAGLSPLAMLQRGATAPGTWFGPPSPEEQKPLPAKPGYTPEQLQAEEEALKRFGQQPWYKALGQMMGIGGQPVGFSGESVLPQKPPIDVEAAVQPQGPLGKGIARGATNLLMPDQLAFMLTMPQSQLMQLYYAGQMSADTLKVLNEARKAHAAGDDEKAKELLGEAVVSGTMAGSVAYHAGKSAYDANAPAREQELRNRQAAALSQIPTRRAAEPGSTGAGPTQEPPAPAAVPQVAPRPTPAPAGQQAASEPITTPGVTGAREIGAGERGAVSAEIERGGPTGGAPTEQPKPTEPTPTPAARETGPDIWRYVLDKGKRDPQWFEKLKADLAGAGADNSKQQAVMQALREEMQNAQRPTRGPEAPAPTAAPQPGAAQQPVPSAQVPAAAPGEPVRPQQEPVPTRPEPVQPGAVAPGQPTGVAPAPAGVAPAPVPETPKTPVPATQAGVEARAPEPAPTAPPARPAAPEPPVAAPPAPVEAAPKQKTWTPLPPEQRPFVRAGEAGKPPAPAAPAPAAPERPSEALPPQLPGERRPTEVVPGVPAPVRPKGGMTPERAAEFKAEQQQAAERRDESTRREAEFKPPDLRNPVTAALDRHLKPTGEFTGDRGEELVNAIQDAKRAGGETLAAAQRAMSLKADRADQMVAWADKVLGATDLDAVLREKLASPRVPGQPTTQFEGGRTEERSWTEEGKAVPRVKREGDPDVLAFMNKVRGNAMRRVTAVDPMTGQPRPDLRGDPQVDARLADAEQKMDALLAKIKEQGGKFTKEQEKEGSGLQAIINASYGTAEIFKHGPRAEFTPELGLAFTGTKTNAQAANIFFDRPMDEQGGTARFTREAIQSKQKEWAKEAKWARDISNELGKPAGTGEKTLSAEESAQTWRPEQLPASRRAGAAPEAARPLAPLAGREEPVAPKKAEGLSPLGSQSEMKAALHRVLDTLDMMEERRSQLKRARKFNISIHDLDPKVPTSVPSIRDDYSTRYTVMERPDGTLEEGPSGSYDTILNDRAAARKEGIENLEKGHRLWVIDLGPHGDRRIRIYNGNREPSGGAERVPAPELPAPPASPPPKATATPESAPPTLPGRGIGPAAPRVPEKMTYAPETLGPLAPKTEEAAAPTPEKAGYGEKNTLFTKQEADAARARFRSKLGESRAGIDPEMVKDLAQIMGYHFEAGAREFADLAKRVIDEFGEQVRPYLNDAYKMMMTRGGETVVKREGAAKPVEEKPVVAKTRPEEPAPTPEGSIQRRVTDASGLKNGLDQFTNDELRRAREHVGAGTQASIDKELAKREQVKSEPAYAEEIAEMQKRREQREALERSKEQAAAPRVQAQIEIPERPERRSERPAGPPSTGDKMREAVEKLGARLGAVTGEGRETLVRRFNDVAESLEKQHRHIETLARLQHEMRQKSQGTRTWVDKETGKERTMTLEQLENAMLMATNERSKFFKEHVPSIKDSAETFIAEQGKRKPEVIKQGPTDVTPVKAPVYDPTGKQVGEKWVTPSEAPEETGRAGKEAQLHASYEHLANLIKGGWTDSKAARRLRREVIPGLLRDLGIHAPAPKEHVAPVLEGESFLRQAKAAEPRPEPKKMEYAPETVEAVKPHDDLFDFLRGYEKTTPLIDAVMTPDAKTGRMKLDEGAARAIAEPIWNGIKADIDAQRMPDTTDAAQRLHKAIDTLIKGRMEARKLPDADRATRAARALDEAIQIATTGKIEPGKAPKEWPEEWGPRPKPPKDWSGQEGFAAAGGKKPAGRRGPSVKKPAFGPKPGAEFVAKGAEREQLIERIKRELERTLDMGGIGGRKGTEGLPAASIGKYAWIDPEQGRATSVEARPGTVSGHSAAASRILGYEKEDLTAKPVEALLDKGWIRKADAGNYEVRNLTPSAIEHIEKDYYRDDLPGKGLIIERPIKNGGDILLSKDAIVEKGLARAISQYKYLKGRGEAGFLSFGGKKVPKGAAALQTIGGVQVPTSTIARQTTPKGPSMLDRMRETSDAANAARVLDQGLDDHRHQQDGMRIRFMEAAKDVLKSSVAGLQKAMYKGAEEGFGTFAKPFPPAAQKFYDDHVRDWADLLEQRYHQLREQGENVENYIPRIALKENSTWDRIVKGSGKYTIGSVLKQTADALKQRSYFKLDYPGAKSDLVVHVADNGKVTIWDNNTPMPTGFTREQMEANGMEFKTAVSDNIVKHTGMGYMQHLFSAVASRAMELDNAWRAREFMDAFKQSPQFKQYFKVHKIGQPIPEGWDTTKEPHFQSAGEGKTYIMEKHFADVLDRFHTHGNVEDTNFIDKLNSGLITSMYVLPFKHMYNIADHWATNIGSGAVDLLYEHPKSLLTKGTYSKTSAGGFLDPRGWASMGRSFVKAYHAVAMHNNDYLHAKDIGMPLRGRSVTTRQMTRTFSDLIDADNGKMASAWGYADPREFRRVALESLRKGLFLVDDFFRMHATYHYADMTGKTFNESWREVSKHLPDYTIPTHVLMRIPGTQIDVPSRTLSKAMESKWTMFGRYHYGRMRSYGEMASSAVDPKLTGQERRRALDHMLVPAFALAMYATLGKAVAQKLTHDKDAEMTPSGATSIPWEVLRMFQGKQGIARTALSTVTPTPLLDFIAREAYGEESRPKSFEAGAEQAVGIKKDAFGKRRLQGGLLGELGPLRTLEQSRTPDGHWRFGEAARRLLLNIYSRPNKRGSMSHLPGSSMPHLPRMR